MCFKIPFSPNSRWSLHSMWHSWSHHPSIYISSLGFFFFFFTIPTTLLIIRSLLCWLLSVYLSPNIESPPQLFLLTFHYVLSDPNYFHDFNSMLKILKSLFSFHFATQNDMFKTTHHYFSSSSKLLLFCFLSQRWYHLPSCQS